MTLWPRGHVRSRYKLKALYLLFWKVYDHETLQGSHLWQGKITYNVTWLSLSHVKSCDKMKMKYLLLNNACDQQLGRMVTYDEENSPIMSHDSLTTWSHEVTWQNKNRISHPLQNLWPPNLAEWWLMIRETHTECQVTLWSRDNVSSRDKFKS